jgi:predicted glycoside hydrolase/deacetylase ChbG (UPF0249 family)
MSAAAPLRPIWLCADDYGISAAVSAGIRELIAARRLNATSAMVVAPQFDRAEALALLDSAGAAAIGLHLTLTAPFEPLTAGFRPLRGGAFLPLGEMLARGSLRLLAPRALRAEIAAQIAAFAEAFGRLPDFIDGHQHVHLFPQVREALLATMAEAAPRAWVRQCGRLPAPLRQRMADRKAMLLDALSRRFRRLARQHGIATNPAFAGTYDFAAAPPPDFARLFPMFLRGLPAGSVVMCHPGHVDAELERLDPLTAQREREYAFLSGDEFLPALAARGVMLG